MIYIPKRAVFVHIPRTAGNSITQAVSTVCVGKNIDVFIGTGSHRYENFESRGMHFKNIFYKLSSGNYNE